MTPEFTRFGTATRARIILAHGAGAGMESRFMQFAADALAKQGFECILFNFPYMQKRTEDGKRRPPDRAPKLLEHYQAIISEVGRDRPLLIGGKSMGGRMASLLAAQAPDIADGLVLLGYPFHPPGKPEKLRTDHLPDIEIPTLLVQGERDTFGGVDLVASLTLPSCFDIRWALDGDHGFKPRKKSGRTESENWVEAIAAITEKNWSND